ncbi:ubiquitin-protein ligase [Angomonas deanei]|uniref:HECT-type E3 ubiquitin transferase n=1 Tax=Angomonas deanei TaxID=59799 RepID=A0A7G2CH39_9TRYP|nr:ubiquitin-protein ligase [Angomonas deanei]CAD2218214.1 HECT-domain (ubiquitin-transferase), putative [Angomonas deanei]|eukprot:EPY36738.1 ubiquitin-protein ligase [Angomonas deanei]
MAFLLLARLHVVNEATQFLPLPSAWVSVRDTLLLRNLDSISVERWTELEEEHLHSGHDAMEDEEEEKKAPQVKPLPGDDTLFTNSCHWSTEERLIRLLLRIAFLVSFNERAKLLTRFLLLSQPQRHPGMPKQFVVHRGRTFVDTYERFKHQPDSVEMFSVRFAGANGEYEEGYGQGVYRELLHCIGLEGFTAEHGLFRTTEDGFVYPNPLSFETTGDEEHLGKISFLGFMCGRSLRDGILQDVPFALHFRNALLGRRNTINNLKGFDAQLYRQLVSLVNLTEEELSLMELTFTYVDNSLGVAREYELVRGGAEMKVNTHNRLFYIDLVADYKLNREGAPQTLAFQAGLERIIHRSWLRLFDSIELFKLFGGDNSGSFDVADWKKHTVYKDPEDEHSVPVKLFWEVVESMTAEQQSALLRFATSMRRPPLLGFQFLSPPFMVYLVKNISSQRLPTASTCFSTFKLPPYTDYGTAREKILAAIEEGTTFELT